MHIKSLNGHLKMIFLILVATLASGCTQMTQPPVVKSNTVQPVKQEFPVGKGWWFARFRMDWPKNSTPKWHMGTWLAGEVISPVLERYRQEIDLWRFHRRAKRDGHGHVFSFIFYSSAPVAHQIYADIEHNALLIRLQKEKQITWVGQDSLSSIIRPKIEDTSDADWPVSVRKSWPIFMSGASEMWLNLVLETAKEQRKKGYEDQALYEIVQSELTRTWMREGQRTLLHHLNALFAYQPTMIRF